MAVSGRIVIMGSGETAPTMVKLHRSLLEQTGPGARAMLDTPFGFQANADDLTDKVQTYFAEAVGTSIEVARWRRRDDSAASRERSLDLLHRSSFVFAGPGSPTFALGQWRETPVPEALVDVVQRDGTVVLGSAAAVTAGSWSVPVYEIYKVGEDPRWVPGLDLLGTVLGLDVAVIPHFDNREGGRHDTRFCYLGAQRLDMMEGLLPQGVGILGVDEHTAVVVDVGDRMASVHGAGGMTLRAPGQEIVVPAGGRMSVDEIESLLRGDRPARASGRKGQVAASDVDGAPAESAGAGAGTSLRDIALRHRERFDECLDAGDAEGGVEEILALEESIAAWSTDTLQSDDLAVARRLLRAMIVALGRAAESGVRDPRILLEPLVNVVLTARARARESRDFATSDQIRDALLAAGIEVRDTPAGQEWDMVSTGTDSAEGAGR